MRVAASTSAPLLLLFPSCLQLRSGRAAFPKAALPALSGALSLHSAHRLLRHWQLVLLVAQMAQPASKLSRTKAGHRSPSASPIQQFFLTTRSPCNVSTLRR